MAQSRLLLHDILSIITEHVYFQPPPNIEMQYPCVIYAIDGAFVGRADNELYRHANKYQVTVIDRDPDTDLKHKIEILPYTAFERFFVADNLNHYVFSLFF